MIPLDFRIWILECEIITLPFWGGFFLIVIHIANQPKQNFCAAFQNQPCTSFCLTRGMLCPL